MVSSPVVVTGCESFYGSHVTYQLLQRGIKVRGTVLRLTDDVRTFLSQFPSASSLLTVVEANLLVAEDWVKAFVGATAVVHCAAPVGIDGVDSTSGMPKGLFHDLHVVGTEHVLRAALATPSIERICHTSSVAAITYGHEEYRYDGHRLFSEDDYSNFSEGETNVTFADYARGKTNAERCAWRLVMNAKGAQHIGGLPSADLLNTHLKNQDAMKTHKLNDGPDLVVICPGILYGPMFSPMQSPCVQKAVRMALYGELDVSWAKGLWRLFEAVGPLCDVRDAARMMVCAVTMPRGQVGNQRFIAAGCNLELTEQNRIVKRLFGEYGFAGFSGIEIPRWVSDAINIIGRVHPSLSVLAELRRNRSCSNAKAVRVMGVDFRPIEDTLRDACLSLMKLGVLESRHVPKHMLDNLKFYPDECNNERTGPGESFATHIQSEQDKLLNHNGDTGGMPLTPIQSPLEGSPIKSSPPAKTTGGAAAEVEALASGEK